MQTVAKVVGRQLILLSGNGDLTFVDAVGITSDCCAIVARRVYGVGILCDVVIAQHDISEITIPVGNHQRHQASAEVGEASLHAVLVFQDIQLDRLFVDNGVELGRIKARKGLAAVTT